LLEGEASLIIKDGNMTNILPMVADCSYHIEPMPSQRLEAIEDTTLVEVFTPEAEDVVRVENDYGRASGSP
jgi:mannose-6-phosphate isomerase